MKIAHLQVGKPKSKARVGAIAAIAARLERLRGVAGVVVVRSMGLLTILYDERRTDPVTLSDAVVAAAGESEEESDSPPAPARVPVFMSARRAVPFG